MNIKKLQAKLAQYISAAELKLSDASTALEAEDYELVKSLQAESDDLMAKAKSVEGQLKRLGEVSSLKPVEPEVAAPEPVRMPFEAAPEEAPAEKKVDVNKAIRTIRYGEEDAAVKAIAQGLYGTDYLVKRADQMDAFVKYLKKGPQYMEGKEIDLLQTVILRPENIREEIESGRSVGAIKADLQEMIADLGGYLVPEDYRAEIVKRLMGLTVVRSRARVASTNRDGAEWPKLEGGGSVYTSAVRMTWVDEIPSDANVSQTNPTFGMLRVPVHTVMARTDISRNMLEDSAFNMLQIIAELFSEAMAIDEDEKFVTGIGGGTPRGVLANRSGAEATPETGIGSVNSGAAGSLTADGIYNLIYEIDSQYRGNGVFVGARTTHRDVRKLKDGNSRYLWEDSMKVGEPATLLGAPYLETESVPTVGANKYPLIFGDFKGYLVVDRVGMSIERVTDTTTVGTNKVALFARRRLGGEVIEPWRFKVQKVAS